MQKLPELDQRAVWSHIETLLERYPNGGIVFDADGTLWSHDVGCMVFELAYQEGLLRPEAREFLLREAQEVGVGVGSGDDANAIARKLQGALLSGTYPLKRAAEMQVWAYVGFTEPELRELCREALRQPSHRAGFHQEVLSIKECAERRGARQVIVSASPRIVVEEATRELGFVPESIAAGDPLWEGGRISPQLGGPLPYGPDKATAGRQLLGSAAWIATFGDSGFDLDMMCEAKLAVGLGNKAELIAGLVSHPFGVRLRLAR